jgi:hypothetical protein
MMKKPKIRIVGTDLASAIPAIGLGQRVARQLFEQMAKLGVQRLSRRLHVAGALLVVDVNQLGATLTVFPTAGDFLIYVGAPRELWTGTLAHMWKVLRRAGSIVPEPVEKGSFTVPRIPDPSTANYYEVTGDLYATGFGITMPSPPENFIKPVTSSYFVPSVGNRFFTNTAAMRNMARGVSLNVTGTANFTWDRQVVIFKKLTQVLDTGLSLETSIVGVCSLAGGNFVVFVFSHADAVAKVTANVYSSDDASVSALFTKEFTFTVPPALDTVLAPDNLLPAATQCSITANSSGTEFAGLIQLHATPLERFTEYVNLRFEGTAVYSAAAPSGHLWGSLRGARAHHVRDARGRALRVEFRAWSGQHL